jgi:threonine dehydrogenase-like Zn-dependent dehydrogenase
MVETFFGFKKPPFGDNPDTKQLFASQSWTQVKARLQFLVDHHGAGLLTGEVGAGKSTAARTFTAGLNPNLYKILYLHWTCGSALDLLRQLGIRTCLLSDLPEERSADIVVDCTGSPTGLPAALRLIRPRGTIVLKTTVAGEQTMAWAPVVIDEVTIIGSRCGPFDRALAALDAGEVSVLPLVSGRFDLASGVEALTHASSKSVMKVLLDIST